MRLTSLLWEEVLNLMSVQPISLFGHALHRSRASDGNVNYLKWDLALVALCMSTSISGYLAVALSIRSLHLMGSGNLMSVQVDSIFGH